MGKLFYLCLFFFISFFSSCFDEETNNSNRISESLNYESDDIYFQLEKSKEQMSKSDLNGAKKTLENLILHHPNNMVLFENRAEVYVRLGLVDSAIIDMNKAISIYPNASTFYRRGQIKYSFNQFNEAILDFDTVIELQPDFGESHYLKAASLIKLNRINEACVCLKTASQLGIDEADRLWLEYCY